MHFKGDTEAVVGDPSTDLRLDERPFANSLRVSILVGC